MQHEEHVGSVSVASVGVAPVNVEPVGNRGLGAEDPGLGQPPPSRSPLLAGNVVFASLDEQSQRTTELLGAGALVVTVPPPTKDMRGRLGELLEELVERELARAGAPSPYLAAWTASPEDATARLADQLFRARTTGATGLAIAMASLRTIALPTLTPDDSATLRWLAETTTAAPLVLLIDDADLHLLGYGPPLSLETLLSRAFDDVTTIDTKVAAVTMVTPPEIEVEVTISPIDHIVAEPIPSPEIEVIVTTSAPPVVREARPEHRPSPLVDRDAEVADARVHAAPVEVAAAPVPAPAVAPVPNRRAPRSGSRSSARATAGVPVSGPNDTWRSWAVALSAAKGAQPLAAFERLFAESYVPLANAVAAGLDDPRAVRACDEFRRSFERSYTDSFATFGATNRRPRLVMDAYDLASKQARLANARTTHVLVVDSMRFDLGCMIRDALARESAGIASFTSEVLLWSALPTTTMRQLETFSRGLDALRAPATEEPTESLRGRSAEVVRRLRVGSRELYKLDLVPAMLDARRQDVVGALPEIAENVAEAIARHIATLPPRTLLFVVGDHGFAVDRRGEVYMGGASPEEVLVPAFSWLVGDLH